MITKKPLSDKYVEQLYGIFESKSWNVQELGKYSVFDRFCERLAELENDNQRDLVMELTEDFLWINSSMYERYLLSAFHKLFQDESWNPEKGKNICICPLLPEREFGKVKSSTFMLYFCQSILLRTYTEFQDEQVRICETPEVLKEKKYRDNIDSIILIDDFIGSGETALESLAYLEFLRQEGKKIYILALVVQKQGMENVRNEGIPVFADIVREKGISDKFESEEAGQKLDEMKKISKLLRVPKELSLGYLDSESLVAMNKTPNNTFPVYWYESKGHSHAPFPRREKCENDSNGEKRRMKERIELLMLDAVKHHGSFMPLFTAGYSYSKVMEWGKQLEKAGELIYSEEGTRSLTELGEQRWKLLKKGKRDFSILPLEGYRIPKLNIDDIYLP